MAWSTGPGESFLGASHFKSLHPIQPCRTASALLPHSFCSVCKDVLSHSLICLGMQDIPLIPKPHKRLQWKRHHSGLQPNMQKCGSGYRGLLKAPGPIVSLECGSRRTGEQDLKRLWGILSCCPCCCTSALGTLEHSDGPDDLRKCCLLGTNDQDSD